ncbi:MAG: UDP-N-acetylglucosamine 2-epimerase [Acidobacteria bacterium]|nr:UDP-N-acetylglucosamine 2-epimerase [Acidobacteriota bacterium]MCA1618593.1 UDP-N-acetylglucosamine 2-epimerase [Acidobacteriota bacterium]
MSDAERLHDPDLFKQAVASANREGRPLYLIALATKPCYIKLASLVLALRRTRVPFIAVDAGQHYEFALTNAKEELSYGHLVGAHLGIRGGLVERTADLARKLQWLAGELREAGLRQPPIPVVSGDTSTAAFFPSFWYLLTGYRSVHVEAGLRSAGPEADWEWRGIEHLLMQRRAGWRRFRDDPFPEGVDTTLASVTSDLLLAPVRRNADNLLREGYDAGKLHLVGSLSADAVDLALGQPEVEDDFRSALARGKWLRVDIHRRENTTPLRLQALVDGLAAYSDQGGKVVLILTNALRSALEQHGMWGLLRDAERQHGVLVQELWPSYLSVVHFLRSPNCLAVYTDSGGLQEEANVLGVPCITCRFSTDRPETVLDGESNILLPPASVELVARGLGEILSSPPARVWPGLAGRGLYGERAGERIAELLGTYTPAAPARGAEFIFEGGFG